MKPARQPQIPHDLPSVDNPYIVPHPCFRKSSKVRNIGDVCYRLSQNVMFEYLLTHHCCPKGVPKINGHQGSGALLQQYVVRVSVPHPRQVAPGRADSQGGAEHASTTQPCIRRTRASQQQLTQTIPGEQRLHIIEAVAELMRV